MLTRGLELRYSVGLSAIVEMVYSPNNLSCEILSTLLLLKMGICGLGTLELLGSRNPLTLASQVVEIIGM